MVWVFGVGHVLDERLPWLEHHLSHIIDIVVAPQRDVLPIAEVGAHNNELIRPARRAFAHWRGISLMLVADSQSSICIFVPGTDSQVLEEKNRRLDFTRRG